MEFENFELPVLLRMPRIAEDSGDLKVIQDLADFENSEYFEDFRI